jgi:hypothetical protein
LPLNDINDRLVRMPVIAAVACRRNFIDVSIERMIVFEFELGDALAARGAQMNRMIFQIAENETAVGMFFFEFRSLGDLRCPAISLHRYTPRMKFRYFSATNE